MKNISDTILEMLLIRGPGKTICPSEVARKLFPEDWRDQMETVRIEARKLVKDGKLVITQKGEVVDPETCKGAIRLKLP
jgi:ATP-dependent protease HslVU (ClpYQ) peptidase subunit